MEDRHRIREWIRFACEKNEAEELAQAVIVEFNRRFTRRMGDALYNRYRYLARIRLSVPLWSRASTDDRRETVIHETCHIIVKYKLDPFTPDHGAEWKQAMKNCGCEPNRFHRIDRTGLYRPQRQFVVLDCPRETKCRISVRQFNLVRKGTEYCCEKCGLHLDRNSAVEEERSLQKMQESEPLDCTVVPVAAQVMHGAAFDRLG